MDVSWRLEQLLVRVHGSQDLPERLLTTLQHGSNSEYLDTLSLLALDPKFTGTIFTTQEPIFVEISSRWLLLANSRKSSIAALAAYARLLPVAPYLAEHSVALLRRRRTNHFEALYSKSTSAFLDLPTEDLQVLLLAMYRLLLHDQQTYASYISPTHLTSLLNHSKPHIRCLAIRVFCIFMYASDMFMKTMLTQYLGESDTAGPWEDRLIDYKFLSLWERERLRRLDQDTQDFQQLAEANSSVAPSSSVNRILYQGDFSSTTAAIAGILLPKGEAVDGRKKSIVMTKTITSNLKVLARGIKSGKPILLSGPPCSGKTLLVNEVAQAVGKSSSLVVLNLNEQVDAKALVGMYAYSASDAAITWRPGILTKAVQDGDWILLENIDRASIELMTTLMPLVERHELLIPNRDSPIRAGPGFKLIATLQISLKASRPDVRPDARVFGVRHWAQMSFDELSQPELAEIASSLFPLLTELIPRMMQTYKTVATQSLQHHGSRPTRPSDFLCWAKRIDRSLQQHDITESIQPVPNLVLDHVFLDAIDSFCGHLPLGMLRYSIEGTVGQGLQMPAESIEYNLRTRRPSYRQSGSTLHIGRVELQGSKSKFNKMRQTYTVDTKFAMTRHFLRILESVAAVVQNAEPCLLVGETGTGKTTILQQLAKSLGHDLHVINLSQQSEASDLLGGFKPTNPRTLASPLHDEFVELLQVTCPGRQNEKFLGTLAKAIAKARWIKVVELWQEALRSVQPLLKARKDLSQPTLQPYRKKRKVQTISESISQRWERFASDLKTFHTYLSRGTKNFAFSFIEGNLVKAVRQGQWVLLDEINLASAETLEVLADLISTPSIQQPSLLLTDTGEKERIQAHNDFRIFGAMNPATDIGKRDLPPSIRSQFTELYINESDQNLSDLSDISETYLGTNSQWDKRLASVVAQLYLDLKKMCLESRLVDGSNNKPHFSLRTLARALTYACDTASSYGLRRAVFEGFMMCFSTSLDTESRSIVRSRIESQVLGPEKNRRAILKHLPSLPDDGQSYVRFQQYWVARGALQPVERPLYIITPFVEQNLLNIVRAASTRRYPVLLQGPTSSGKTSMIEYLASISGNKYIRINNHEHTDLQEYLGMYVSAVDGKIEYQDGVLVKALREGHWIVLDELNLAPSDVLESLNRLLDDNRELLIPETQEIIRPHKHFMLFATQNPAGIYGGRKVLSRAFRNRFLEIHFEDIPEDELGIILRERTQIAPSFCAKIIEVYRQLTVLRQRDRLFEQKQSFATLRDLFRWAMRAADDRTHLAVNGFLLLSERVRNERDRMAVKEVIETVLKTSLDINALYGWQSSYIARETLSEDSQGVIWTKSMRRVYVLVNEALKNKEPVLLVGETGSGKTTVCQVISQIMGRKLHTVNAHQNLETGDIIGAQRPFRLRASAERELSQAISKMFEDHGYHSKSVIKETATLVREYDDLIESAPNTLSQDEKAHIAFCRARSKTLFEWSDGSLVTAMRNGSHFLLDEISLADDSVLERLNSVLEPSRTLYLAEKGTSDASVEASVGFQFMATMNPGGDYGKKELSPALRNRFTEIWVPTASDAEELEEIVEAKLQPQCRALASGMVTFATWFAELDGSSHGASIRDLIAWTAFVNHFSHLDISFSVYHGAEMIYLDRLGTSSSVKLVGTESAFSHTYETCLSKLEQVFMIPRSQLESRLNLVDRDDSFHIGDFSLNKMLLGPSKSTYNLSAPTTLKNAHRVIRAYQLDKPILLEGLPGVGKTSLVEALAAAIGMPLTRINLSDQTDLIDLLGSDVPIASSEAGLFGWRDAPFLKAMQRGEWVLLDEMNLASQSVLEGLNACLDHRGEVYVSELDQTFARHSRFRLFASQNPHTQGGGRKGLPASFTDRFTVVYTDTLGQEDLRQICTDSFPTVDPGLVEKMTRYVSEAGVLVGKRSNQFLQGGPWEVNLRDAARWLQILECQFDRMEESRPEDYQDMLFHHRFRTPEDRNSMMMLQTKHFRGPGPSLTHHTAKTAEITEIGQGIMRRDQTKRYLRNRTWHMQTFNISITESVLLCIERSWPTILVGPSRSGKTEVILHLADLMGAEVVEMCLNPDMDTMDLVGGFEQVDEHRQFDDLLMAVKTFTKEQLIEHGIRCHPNVHRWAEALANLEQCSDPQALTLCLQNLSSLGLSTRYGHFLAVCGIISRNLAADNRARFEWVDGLLVRALRQGKWLVLDNANLCSPSVLDRLNALLEPNGCLSIHEHCDEHGNAETVKPHPNFRLFMTMDPRHGELSGAMRNRSVELFMQSGGDAPSITFHPLDPTIDASDSGFAPFQKFGWLTKDVTPVIRLLSVCFNHLPLGNIDRLQEWESQVTKGLCRMTPEVEIVFRNLVHAYRRLCSSDRVLVKELGQAYSLFFASAKSSVNLGSLQPMHPYNNSVLMRPGSQPLGSSSLAHLGRRFELISDIIVYNQKVATIRRAAQSKLAGHLTPLERSFASSQYRESQQDPLSPMGKFLENLGQWLESIVDSEDFEQSHEEFHAFACEILLYLEDVLKITHSSSFGDSVLQVLLTAGQSLIARSSHLALSNELATRIAHDLSAIFNPLNFQWQLYSGCGMQQLWQSFGLSPYRTKLQFEASIKISKLAERMDDIRFRLDIPMTELLRQRKLLLDIKNASGRFEISSPAAFAIDSTIEKLCDQSPSISLTQRPHFEECFDQILQYSNLSKYQDDRIWIEVALLAGQSTKTAMDDSLSSGLSKQISSLQSSLLSQCGNNDIGLIRQTLSASVLKKNLAVDKIPIGCLHRVKIESLILLKAVLSLGDMTPVDPVGYFGSSLQRLRNSVSIACKPLLQDEDKQVLMQKIDLLPRRLNGLPVDPDALSSPNSQETPQTRYLKEAISYALGSSDGSDNLADGAESSPYKRLGGGMLKFFTGCLLLYIPDRSYDPALRALMEQECYSNRYQQLSDKLAALQTYEYTVSGQSSSHYISRVKDAMEELGAISQANSVYRPSAGNFGALTKEFNAILRGIVLSIPALDAVQAPGAIDAKSVRQLESLRRSIGVVAAKLSTGFPAFEDVVKPLIAMLKCLDAGLALYQIHSSDDSMSRSIIDHIGRTTPFMGSNNIEVSTESYDHSQGIRSRSFDSASHFLDRVIAVAEVENRIPPTTIDSMLRAFHDAYQEWKEQLDKDQLQYATTSSIYRYQPEADQGLEAEEDEISRLFPLYEGAEDTMSESVNLARDPRKTAVELARFQRRLLGQRVGPSNEILTLLQGASGHVAQLWNDKSNLPIFPIPLIDMLPALFMDLSGQNDKLCDSENDNKLYDFYTDANHAEVQKLVPLIRAILAKYSDLQTIWPEHATLTDVLRSSRELLEMPHTDPLAKLLTKVEKIHSYMHEWQGVASREYSTVSLFDQLSQTIITWRRKELSSWSTLLDKEDEQCRVTADSWWFIAYETIIAAPLSAAASEDQKIYAQSLLLTLTDFLSSTSLGQFCQRMKILSAFERHAELAAGQCTALREIANALRNFVSYHTGFIPIIENILNTGRKKMEKDLKEVLLLASWKDTTIVALRDSAKRSHFKLFKIVRKYRALLAQTVEGILNQGLSDGPIGPETDTSLGQELPIISLNGDAKKTCQTHVPDWASKPARFKNPEVTVQTMHRLGLLRAGGLSPSLNLNEFADALVTSIDSLQKATPNTMNDENSQDASYVKSRKRKLYSDTMRELRQMGFRSNLSTDVLKQQDSTSKMLSGTPSLQGLQFSNAPVETESHFHQLVNLVPQVRAIMHQHSEDLNHELVAQSQGMFEDLLKTMLGQRRVIAETASNLSKIRAVSEEIEVTVAPKYNGQLQLSNKESHAKILRTSQWLSAILGAAIVIIEKCGRLSETDNSLVQEVLEGHRSTLDASITKLNGLPKMPAGLTTASKLALFQEAVEEHASVRDSLSSLKEKSPHLTFVFRQVELWTCRDPVDCARQADERQPIEISHFDADVRNALDSMLVAVQDMAAQLALLPTSDSEPKWLVKADQANAQALKSLHTDSIAPLLEGVASLMCRVQNPQGEGLTVASALCSMAVPIIQQYNSICSSLLSDYVRSYRSLSRLAILLAKTFVRIGKDGFCNPPEQSKNENRQNEKVEEGTGIGSGEGAQDISNEIQDDEDLSELAQEGKAEKGEDSMEKQDDAVNMNHDELEGGMSNGSEADDASVDGSQDDEGNELDEEQGDVDELDPTAVDEKLWDGKGDDHQREKEGESSKSQPNEAEQSAAVSAQRNEEKHEEMGEEDHASDHEGAEESEAVAREEAEALDPHTEEGQNLELPEGMHLDSQKSPVSEVDSQDDMDFEEDLDEDSLEKMSNADENDNESLDETASRAGTPEGADADGQETQEGEESSPSADVPDGIDNRDDKDDLSLEQSADAAATAKSSSGKRTDGLAQDHDLETQDAEMDGIDGTGEDNEHHSAADQPVREELSGHGEQSARTDRTQARGEQTESTAEELPRQMFHQLGDALEQWYRQQKQILEATERDTDNADEVANVDMKDQEIEDLPDDVDGGDQVLGAATQEQVRGLDDRAFRSEVEAQDSQYPPIDEMEEESTVEGHEMEEGLGLQLNSNDLAADSVRSKKSFISAREEGKAISDEDQLTREDEEDIDDLDQDLSTTSIQPSTLPSVRSDHQARQTWLQYENATRDLSFYLTEQLRLILSPTQATKLRGDFRTGKRLNMKRIIPYIASDFKKNKIWMRRSAPSKRTYQIMLAVDDSKSMRQSESPHLAFGALALITKSLSMLEVGQVCVVGFGNDVVVAHGFDTPLSSEAGGDILKTFGFQQPKTDVAKLVTESIALFRDARRRGSHSSADLWQLELIISDGLCEDHERIRRLVRQAQEERIMMVFIIVDALNPGESIVDMNQAAFEADAASGESKLKIKRYLDGFPFPFYLIVGDVKELPAVLAQALRQWFAEVADAS